MSEPLVFHDLVPLDRPTTGQEDAWLASIAREADAAALAISVAPSHAAQEPDPVLYRDVNGWRAGRYIGELRRDGRVLEIRPRLGIDVIAAWASAALNVRVLPHAAEQRGSAALIAELMGAIWRTALVEAARHGLPGFRETRLEESLFARGRIAVRQTLRARSRGRPHLVSATRPKLLDNAAARVLVLADRALARRIARLDWRGPRVEELMPRLQAAAGTRPPLPSRRQLDQIRYTPLTLPYRRAVELSWRIAKQRGLRAAATAEKVDGVLIDVAELWELFVLHCARRAFGERRVTHGARLHDTAPLLRSGHARLGRLYPDVLVGPTERPEAIIDAKYKRLADPRGVDREDLYQLNAYLSIHPHQPQPHGLLAYPALPDSRTSYAEANSPWRGPREHPFSFRRLPLTEDGTVAALLQIMGVQPSAVAPAAVTSPRPARAAAEAAR